MFGSFRLSAIAGTVWLVVGAGCKQTPTEGTAGASLSSVAIKLPDSVKGVNLVRLTGNTATVGSDRTFEETINSTTSGGSVVSFTRDTQNENLKIGDNLYTVTLELLSGSNVVYSGTGDRDPFVVQAGENRISFKLQCQDRSACPDGANLEVIDVEGSTADAGATPSILADIQVDEAGMTTGQKRQLLQGCQTQVKKKTCSQWGTEVSSGDALCQDILSANPSSVCEGAGTVRTCLDDYIGYCKDLGVVR